MSTRRVLIIAKTYPELSSKYGETVCTAAVGEDGIPVRLYPIPFRYLQGPQRFKRYQWISAELAKNQRDPRPESFNVDAESIRLEQLLKASSDEWGLRSESVLKHPNWQYMSMQKLFRDQQKHGRSLAFVRPTSVTRVTVRQRTAEDARTFEEKLNDLRIRNAAKRSQLDLFENTVPPAMKRLEFLGQRVCVDWVCADDRCDGHSMQILDWEICELARREGLDAARLKVETLLDLSKYKTGLILGNFHMFPSSFAIIGLWYPLINPLLF